MWRGRTPKGLGVVIAVIASAMTTAALASTMIAMDLDELARRADEIVIGTVVTAQAEPAKGIIITRYLLRVETSVAGRARPADELEIIAAGGELGGVGVAVHGSPRLAVGGRYLLFLRQWRQEFTVVGQAQGAFPVRSSARAGELIVEPAQDLPMLVRREQGQLVSATAAVMSPTPLGAVISTVREARNVR